jgi:hypothetical protein
MKRNLIHPAIMALLVLLVFFGGCRKTVTYEDLPTPMVVQLYEEVLDGERRIAIGLRTIENYPCNNFQIIFSYLRSLHSWDLIFRGLYAPRICVTVVGPAWGHQVLNDFTDGAYTLNFIYGSHYLAAKFHVSEEELVVDLPAHQGNFLVFPDVRFTRVPSDFFWGYVLPVQEGTVEPYDTFYQDLLDAGAWAPELDDGHYGFFRITDGKLVVDPYQQSQSLAHQHTFVFGWDGEFHEIESLAAAYAGVFEIQVFSAQGHNFCNQQ